jgi:hypothetical protein
MGPVADGILTVFESSVFLTLVVGLIGLPKPLRKFAAPVLLFESYLGFFLTWLWCLVAMGALWGTVPIVIGILLGIVGIVPVAMAMLLFTGHWSLLFSVILMLAAGSVFRIWWFGYSRPDKVVVKRFNSSE